jgi:hypothetical protein
MSRFGSVAALVPILSIALALADSIASPARAADPDLGGPILVAELSQRLRSPQPVSVEFPSSFPIQFDSPAEQVSRLAIAPAELPRLFDAAPLAIELPPEDFRELDEFSPRLTTSSLDANDQRSVVGGRLLKASPLKDGGRLNTEARLLWLCEFLQNENAPTAFFAPGDSAIFATQGLSYGSNWAMLGGRLQWELVGGLTAFAGYDTQLNSQQMFHIGSTGLKYAW